MTPHIVLLSDFGTADGYAAVMRGVILSHDASLSVHDGAHNIRTFSVSSAGYVLHTVLTNFPEGTIAVCVVDPGVGTERSVIIAQVDHRVVVLPDNGIMTIPHTLAHEADYWSIQPDVLARLRSMQPEYSSTFDGRDVMAPLGARIATDGIASVTGAPVTPQLVEEHVPTVISESTGPVTGTIIHIDHFGNAISSIRLDGPAVAGNVRVKDARLPIHATFGDAREGEPLAYWGSFGFLEVGVREGSAEEDLGLSIGADLVLVPDAASGQRAAKTL